MDPMPMSDDLDPLATRSLFVGNIPKHISVYELRDAFLRYGNVLVSLLWVKGWQYYTKCTCMLSSIVLHVTTGKLEICM